MQCTLIQFVLETGQIIGPHPTEAVPKDKDSTGHAHHIRNSVHFSLLKFIHI